MIDDQLPTRTLFQIAAHYTTVSRKFLLQQCMAARQGVVDTWRERAFIWKHRRYFWNVPTDPCVVSGFANALLFILSNSLAPSIALGSATAFAVLRAQYEVRRILAIKAGRDFGNDNKSRFPFLFQALFQAGIVGSALAADSRITHQALALFSSIYANTLFFLPQEIIKRYAKGTFVILTNPYALVALSLGLALNSPLADVLFAEAALTSIIRGPKDLSPARRIVAATVVAFAQKLYEAQDAFRMAGASMTRSVNNIWPAIEQAAHNPNVVAAAVAGVSILTSFSIYANQSCDGVVQYGDWRKTNRPRLLPRFWGASATAA